MTARADLSKWTFTGAILALAAGVGVLAGIDPVLALGASAALVFVGIAFTNLTAALVTFVLISFFEFLLGGGAVLSLTKATGLLLAIAWLAETTRPGGSRNYFAEHPFGGFLLIAFLVWALLGLGWAESSAATTEDVVRYLLVLSLFVITYTAGRTRSNLAWILGAFLIGTAATAALAMISTPTADPTEVARTESTFGNANQLATVLVAGLTLSIGAALAFRRSPAMRAAALAIATLCAVSLVFTGSRSGVISLGVCLIVAVLVAGPQRRGMALVAAIAAAVSAVLLFVSFAPEGIKERIAQTTPGQVPATESRLTIWQVGWRMFEDNPVRGVGVGNFQTSSIHYLLQPGALTRPDEVIIDPKDAHNIYLMALAETGVIGTVILLSLLGFPIGCALVAARDFNRSGDRQFEIMARALVVALAGFLAANFFATDIFSKMLWLLLGLGPAMLAVARSQLSETGAEGSEREGTT